MTDLVRMAQQITRPRSLIRDADENLPTIREMFAALDARSPSGSSRYRKMEAKIGYEHPDLGDDPQPDPYASADMALINRIAAFVSNHAVYRRYPGWAFRTQHQRKGGVVLVSLQPFMGPINHYIIPIPLIESDIKLRLIENACGEILERYRLSRTGFNEHDFYVAANAVPFWKRRHAPVPV